MRRRKRFVIILPAVAILSVLVAFSYLRISELLVSTRSELVGEISRATGKSVFVGSVRLSFMKGLTLDKVVIHDGRSIIIRADEVSCGLILPAVLSKRLIIPVITVSSPVISAERSPDGSLNLLGLISKDYVPRHSVALSVHKIVLKRGRVTIIDRMKDPPFSEEAEALDAEIRLYLPVRVLYKASFSLGSASTRIFADGEYIFPNQAMLTNISVKGLTLKEYARYYAASGYSFPSGLLDAKVAINAHGGLLEASLSADAKNLSVVKDELRASVSSAISASLGYDIKDKKLSYHGRAVVHKLAIDGLGAIGRVENAGAIVEFNDSRIFAEGVRVEALETPWEVRFNLVNLAEPIIDIYASSDVRLAAIQKMLKSKMGVKIPLELSGKGRMRVSLQIEKKAPAKLNGSIRVEDATAGLGRANFPIENINGDFEFGQDWLKWTNAQCTYRETNYRTSGRITDFASAHAALDVESRDLSYKTEFRLAGSALDLTRLDGKYFNSAFSAKGVISFDDPATIDADLKGELNMMLADILKMPGPSAGSPEMKPSGSLKAAFSLVGDMKDLKTCVISSKVRSEEISAYGLKLGDVTFSYEQEQGVGSIKSLRGTFYGGTLTASGSIDWAEKVMPCSMKLDAIGIKLERLKTDTGFKEADVSGDIKIYADLKGVFGDLSRLGGIGHLGIKRGRLWQLDLFKGAGKLIFNSDFGDIDFTEGACDFRINDSSVVVENLVMKADELKLTGAGSIGFDRSVRGILRPEVMEDAVAGGTPGKFAIAVGQGTVIDISGTLADPQFKTRTNVVDVVGAFMGQ